MGLEIINADSRLIFDEMNIGTAKPDESELASVKHHLINIRKPDQIYSSGDYRKDFDKVFASLGKAVIVGGTGMYLQAALENLSMPEVTSDQEFRDKLEEKNLEDLLKDLEALDPASLDLIDINNRRRVIRALEVIKISGKKYSEQRTKENKDRHDALWIGLNFKDREKHYELINERVLEMVEAGLLAEVADLLEKYGKTKTLMNTIGYGEMIKHIEGEISLDEAIALIQKKTRNYAKRQNTWFNKNEKIKWHYLDLQ